MSYSIYKKARQNKDNTFDVTVASSNLFDYSGKRVFSEYHMEYYAKNYPMLDSMQVKVLFLMQASYNGDVFYPANWKKDLELVKSFLNTVEDPYKSVYTDDLSSLIKFLVKALKFMSLYKESNKAGKYIVKIGCDYVAKKTSTRVFTTFDKNRAKVFKKPLCELEMMFYGYKNYGVKFEEKE